MEVALGNLLESPKVIWQLPKRENCMDCMWNIRRKWVLNCNMRRSGEMLTYRKSSAVILFPTLGDILKVEAKIQYLSRLEPNSTGWETITPYSTMGIVTMISTCDWERTSGLRELKSLLGCYNVRRIKQIMYILVYEYPHRATYRSQ